ncbi:MAG: hypothetical protein VB032_02550 [Burkholderiaceae bacterium]|nr:hypothetical protein [Burkholderiaceae bacterium]
MLALDKAILGKKTARAIQCKSVSVHPSIKLNDDFLNLRIERYLRALIYFVDDYLVLENSDQQARHQKSP